MSRIRLKKPVFLLTLLSCFSPAFWAGGCSDCNYPADPYLEIAPTEMMFSADGGTRFLSVETDGADWSYGIFESEGERSGCRVERSENGLNVTMPVAVYSGERQVRIVVTTGSGAKTLRLRQEGISLGVDADTLEFGPEGGTQRVNVESNLTHWLFGVEEPEGMQGRCTAVRERKKLAVTLSPDSSGSGYEALITIRAGAVSRTVSVVRTTSP